MKQNNSNYDYKKMPDENFNVDIFERVVNGNIPICEMHWHEHIQFYYFTEGHGLMICNSQKFSVNPKDFVVVNSNELHYTESLSEGLTCYIIRVDLSFLFSSQTDICQTKFIAPLTNNLITFKNLIHNDENISKCIEAILLEFFRKDYGYELLVKSYLFKLIVLLLRDYVDKQLTQSELNSRITNLSRMNKVFDFIEDNYTKKINISELALLANISDYHFCKLFKQAAGRSPINYINSLRINKAITLLNAGNHNITEVALACGFDDSNYFSRVFKKHKGISPIKFNK